jgi:hypothetical protein
VWTARWLRLGSVGSALGTAKETRTPSRSRRRSQCSRVAWCSWTTNRGAASARGRRAGLAGGSGVAPKSRLASYSASLRAIVPTGSRSRAGSGAAPRRATVAGMAGHRDRRCPARPPQATGRGAWHDRGMPSPWPLSAPSRSSCATAFPGQGPPALKLAVLELVGRRVLRVESEPRRLGRRTWVAAGGNAPPAAGPLAGLARTSLRETAGGRGRLDKVVARPPEAHGRSADRWLRTRSCRVLEGPRAPRPRAATDARRSSRDDVAPHLGGRDRGGRPRGAARGAAPRGCAPRRPAGRPRAGGGDRAAVLLAGDAWPLVEDLRRRRPRRRGRRSRGGRGDGTSTASTGGWTSAVWTSAG